MTYRTRVGVSTVLPLAFILAAAACSDSGGTDAGDPSGGFGNGDAFASGGTGSGGLATGGTDSGSGGFSTGGTNSSSGGLATGGTSSGTGGLATGGTTSATGGRSSATGGTSSGSGGFSTGGTSSATGGRSSAAGGTSSGSGGFSTGGISSGFGGFFATGGIGSGTDWIFTGGTSSGSGGFSTGDIDSGTGGLATGGVDSGTAGTDTGGSGSTTEPTFHIFMLMGQSNMAGVAKFENSDKNTDERLLVLGGCNQPAGQWNIANPPLSDCPGEKGWNPSDRVDPGIWFGKTLLGSLPEGDTIGLVGTAESGESIDTFISGGSHHQMILNKINLAKQAEHARFAGVIFHQGESDSGNGQWPGKVVQLYEEVKAAWGVDYDVPFILGELPEGGCCAKAHNPLVKTAAEALPMGYFVSQDGTNVLDQYHFDHASVVLMGTRYGETMIEALGW